MTHNRVIIPVAPDPTFRPAATIINDLPFGFTKRTVMLEPREINGITRMVAYDRETDTLLLKDSAE